MSNFMKIRPVGVELFHGGGRTDKTDMTKLIVALRNLRTRLKNLVSVLNSGFLLSFCICGFCKCSHFCVVATETGYGPDGIAEGTREVFVLRNVPTSSGGSHSILFNRWQVLLRV